jgi:hypothetical protein
MLEFDCYRKVLIEHAPADTLSTWFVVIAIAVFFIASA